MGYDRGESFPFDFEHNLEQFSFRFEPNGITFGLKSKGKQSPPSYPIQFEGK